MRRFLVRQSLFLLAMALFISSGLLQARAPVDYAAPLFREAQEKNEYILLHIYAGWCGMCKAQKRIVDPVLSGDPAFRKVVFLRADYEKELNLLDEFKDANGKKPGQSTLIILKGKNEIARIQHATTDDELIPFLRKNVPSE